MKVDSVSVLAAKSPSSAASAGRQRLRAEGAGTSSSESLFLTAREGRPAAVLQRAESRPFQSKTSLEVFSDHLLLSG